MFRFLLFLSLALAACQKDESLSGYADPSASYTLTELNGAPFAASATIAFPEQGVVRGPTC